MMGVEHFGYIFGSYALTILAVGGCLAFVLLDYRAQVKKLAALEASGLTRRSQKPAGPASASAERPDWDVT